MTYLIQNIRITRGQSDGREPYTIARVSRKRAAQGETRMHRNSLGELLLEKFSAERYILNYYEYTHYYIFIVEDGEGIYHEAHVFMVEEGS